MTSFLELVRARQSTRRYTPQPVPREALERCLEAARLAPSACNSQPWSFVVVDDVAAVAGLAGEAFSGIYFINRWAASAPVMIVVVTEHSRYITRMGGQIRNVRYNLIDIGIACEHLALQAADEGLGTCWIGWFDEGKVKRTLNLPAKKRIDVMLSLGYPADKGVREKTREPLDAIRGYWQG